MYVHTCTSELLIIVSIYEYIITMITILYTCIHQLQVSIVGLGIFLEVCIYIIIMYNDHD